MGSSVQVEGSALERGEEGQSQLSGWKAEPQYRGWGYTDEAVGTREALQMTPTFSDNRRTQLAAESEDEVRIGVG